MAVLGGGQDPMCMAPGLSAPPVAAPGASACHSEKACISQGWSRTSQVSLQQQHAPKQ
jgi:hypothetical protein